MTEITSLARGPRSGRLFATKGPGTGGIPVMVGESCRADRSRRKG
jgi:hypothetical protein